MTQSIRTIGIIGAGKLGIVVAQLAIESGYEVYISGSGDPEKIRLAVDVLSPGAKVARTDEVVHASDVVILALPLGRFRQLSAQSFAHKIVIDAMNYWWEVDGPREEIIPQEQSSSEAVQEFLSDAYVVKALSHLSYHDLHDGARPGIEAEAPRKAVGVAGDDDKAVRVACDVVERLGFAALVIGPLAQGRLLEPGYPAFGASVSLDELRHLTKQ